jgi:hypothetical protein
VGNFGTNNIQANTNANNNTNNNMGIGGGGEFVRGSIDNSAKEGINNEAWKVNAGGVGTGGGGSIG